MKKITTQTCKLIALAIVFTLFATSIISSCSSTSTLSAQKSGAELWGQNCIHCHNTPSPETFSDTEWDVAVTHMQVRAMLTKEEAEKIAEFLKTAN
uniref:Cytochrome c n=1 Tax=Roseihalotalea indica TaxID=2867963 RepID=A0AA49GUH6_9BACT|nr:cytochrome c [Tunicatimonas sp. TK19036]